MATNPLVATLLAMAGQQKQLLIPRAFVHFTGSLESAMMLNQLLYWQPRKHGEAIYKTDRDWADELCLTRYAVRKARECLAAMGFLTFATHHVNGSPAVHYTIDFDVLVELWTSWLQEQEVKSENELYPPPSKVRNRTLPDESSSKTNSVKFENELSKVRKRTIIKEHRVPTENTSSPPTPTRAESENGGGGDDFYQELRRRGVGQAKARQIAALAIDPAATLALIDHRPNASDPNSLGRLIIDILDGVAGQAIRPRAAAPLHATRANIPDDMLAPADLARQIREMRR